MDLFVTLGEEDCKSLVALDRGEVPPGAHRRGVGLALPAQGGVEVAADRRLVARVSANKLIISFAFWVGGFIGYLVVMMYCVSKLVPLQSPLSVRSGLRWKKQAVQEVVSNVQGMSFQLKHCCCHNCK